MSLVSAIIRYRFKKGDDERDAGLKTPDDVIRRDGILYGSNRKWQVMDIYYPKAHEGKLPVIVSVHGGGWVYGTKETYQYYCMDLCRRGFAVVNFTYRLAPRFKYPAQLQDLDLVMNWLEDHKKEYPFDTDNVFAVGDSAGGHLLSLYRCLLDDEKTARSYGLKMLQDVRLKAVGLNCGVYDQRGAKKGMMKTLMKDLLKGGGSDQELEEISPILHIGPSFPPAYVMTATGDFLLEQARPMYEALISKGVKAEYRCYGDEENRLPHVFHCNIKTEDAKTCNDDECDFFRKMI